MSTTSPRAVLAERSGDRAPRPALWCQATARSLRANPSSTIRVVIDEYLISTVGWSVREGEVRVLVAPSWRWPADEVDMVGELEITDGPGGLSIVGWWARTAVAPVSDAPAELRMDVAALTLWDASRRICTEDHSRITSLLA